MFKLANFFVQCKCGEDLRFDYIDQTRICECGRNVRIADSVKKYLTAEYSARPKISDKKEIGSATYRIASDFITFEQYYELDNRNSENEDDYDPQVESISSSDGKLSHHRIDGDTRKALLEFIDRYRETLRRLS